MAEPGKGAPAFSRSAIIIDSSLSRQCRLPNGKSGLYYSYSSKNKSVNRVYMSNTFAMISCGRVFLEKGFRGKQNCQRPDGREE